MPDINQYEFKHKELLEALVKQAGLHEGRWQLIVNFGLAGANVGPSDDQMTPGAVVAVQWIGLSKATDTSPPALVIDAAEVNPASTSKRRPSSRSQRAAQAKG
jgi:hypothetical protein